MNQTSKTKTKITVAGVPEHFNMPWHTAVEAGRFDEAGIDLIYRDYPGGTGAMTKALAAGEVDLALLLTEGAVADLIKRRQTQLIKTYVKSPLIWGIHVAADSDIQTVDQIRDRKYAVSRMGSGSHLMAIVDAAERGWETDDLDFAIVRNLDGAREALADDDADIFLWEQFTTQPFIDNGEFRRVGLRKTLWPAFVVTASNDALSTKSAQIKTALEIINAECDALMKNKNAGEVIAQRYDLDLMQVREWMSLTRWSTDFDRPDEALTKVLNYLNRLEIIDAPKATVDELWCDI